MFITFFWALRRVHEFYPTILSEPWLWMPSVGAADPSFAMPVVAGLSMWLQVEVRCVNWPQQQAAVRHSQTARRSSRWRRRRNRTKAWPSSCALRHDCRPCPSYSSCMTSLRYVAHGVRCCSRRPASHEHRWWQAIFVYWSATSLFGAAQSLLFRMPAVRQLLQLPPIVKTAPPVPSPPAASVTDSLKQAFAPSAASADARRPSVQQPLPKLYSAPPPRGRRRPK